MTKIKNKMIKSNQILLPVIMLVVIGILICGGCMSPVYEKSTNNKNTEIIENNTNRSNMLFYTHNTTEKTLNQDLKPKFNIGDRFVYEFTNTQPPNLIEDAAPFLTFFNDSVKCILEYNVTNKIEVNKTTYFKIQENAPKCTIGVWNLKGVLKPVSRGGYTKTIYLDEDTGEMFTGVETEEKQKKSKCYWSGCWYVHWMLKLEDDAMWQEEIAYSENEITIYEFSVESREIIAGRECFEVKKNWTDCLNGSCRVSVRELYFIDVEKRITLGHYLWYEDFPVRETRLTEQNYFNKTNNYFQDYKTKTNASEYNKRMRLINRIGYCEDNFCNPENNETMESCCMDCGCSEGKVCNGVCMQDDGSDLKFSSKVYGFNITLPSGWRGKWRGDSIFFELASEPWTSVEVFFGSSAGKTPQYAYYTSDNLTAGNKNFTLIYSAPAQDDYENNLGLYEEIRGSFRGDLN